MNDELEHKIHVVVGIFTLSCLVSTIYYGFDMIIVLFVGLFVIAAILQGFGGGTNRR